MDDGPQLVNENFCKDFLEKVVNKHGVEISFKSRQQISSEFKNLGFHNPGHILESLKYIVLHNWFRTSP